MSPDERHARMGSTDDSFVGGLGPITQIQVVACDIQAFNGTEEIDLETGNLETVFEEVSMGWTPWSVPSAPPDGYLTPVHIEPDRSRWLYAN